MKLFPAFLDLSGVPVLLVGGGQVATRRAQALAWAGARLTVVALQVRPELAALAQQVERRPFEAADLAGTRLVVAATSDPAVNEQVAALARAAGIWVNQAGRAEGGDLQTGVLLERDGVSIAVNTGRHLPMLAQALRDRIGRALPERLPLTDWSARRENALKLDGAAREAALGALKADIRAWVGL